LVILDGLDTNSEQTTDVEDAGQDSLEALLSLQYSRFHYHHPKQNFSLSLLLFPNLTESGRFRATFNSDRRQEIIRNFFFNLSLYSIYGNQPPEGTLASTDYGIVTSTGYSFSP